MNNLEEKQKVAGIIAQAHDLLSEGSYPGKYATTVVNVQAFLRKFHEEMLEDLEKEEANETKESVEEVPGN